jgi:pilus assembly protein Flp/PilA
MKMWASFFHDESGVTAVEYALIVSMIAIIIIGAVKSVGSHLSTTFTTVAASL